MKITPNLKRRSAAFFIRKHGMKLRTPLVVVVTILALAGITQAATDFCQQTAQDALQACQAAAESARLIAVGTCENIADRHARTDCLQQATADFQAAQQTCQAGFTVRQTACEKFGPSRYDPVINPADFVAHVTNPFFPLPPGTTFVYEG